MKREDRHQNSIRAIASWAAAALAWSAFIPGGASAQDEDEDEPSPPAPVFRDSAIVSPRTPEAGTAPAVPGAAAPVAPSGEGRLRLIPPPPIPPAGGLPLDAPPAVPSLAAPGMISPLAPASGEEPAPDAPSLGEPGEEPLSEAADVPASKPAPRPSSSRSSSSSRTPRSIPVKSRAPAPVPEPEPEPEPAFKLPDQDPLSALVSKLRSLPGIGTPSIGRDQPSPSRQQASPAPTLPAPKGAAASGAYAVISDSDGAFVYRLPQGPMIQNRLAPGEVVQVLEEAGDRRRVRPSRGGEGWVNASALRKASAAQAKRFGQ